MRRQPLPWHKTCFLKPPAPAPGLVRLRRSKPWPAGCLRVHPVPVVPFLDPSIPPAPKTHGCSDAPADNDSFQGRFQVPVHPFMGAGARSPARHPDSAPHLPSGTGARWRTLTSRPDRLKWPSPGPPVTDRGGPTSDFELGPPALRQT